MTLLRRLGNKAKLADKIIPLFPPHETYIEPFFGAGGIFFAKPRAKQNFLNDLDGDVANLWRLVSEDKQGLIEWLELMPISEELFLEWGRGKLETDPILKACRFLMLSNFGYMSKLGTLKLEQGANPKTVLMRNIKNVQLDLNAQNNTFANKDFRKAITSIAFRNESDRQKCFMFLDPPYLGCENNYSHSFTESDSADLFKTAVESRIPFAMSEFNQPFILEQARHYNLNIHVLGERQNMKNRRTEILITNYQLNQPTLF